MSGQSNTAAGVAAPRGQTMLERRTRLATGLVLFTFVLTHLLNHSLGMISLEAMEAGRRAFLALWRSTPGTVALAASILLHLALALRSIYLRRHFRVPAWEALQLLFGLAIPLLVINHAVGTRLANERFGFEDSYAVLVLLFWETRPDLGLQQALLLSIAWIHGCIGLHFWLRIRFWYARWAIPLYTFAVLIPVLALLGFAQAGKEISALAIHQGWINDTFAAAHRPDDQARAALQETGKAILYLLIALLRRHAGAARGPPVARGAKRDPRDLPRRPRGHRSARIQPARMQPVRAHPPRFGMRRSRSLLDVPRAHRRRPGSASPAFSRGSARVAARRGGRRRAPRLPVASDRRHIDHSADARQPDGLAGIVATGRDDRRGARSLRAVRRHPRIHAPLGTAPAL